MFVARMVFATVIALSVVCAGAMFNFPFSAGIVATVVFVAIARWKS